MATYSNAEIFSSTSAAYNGTAVTTSGSGTTKFSIHTAPATGVSRVAPNFNGTSLTITFTIVSALSGVTGGNVVFVANGLPIASATVLVGNSTTLTIPADSVLVNGGELYVQCTQIGGPNNYDLQVTTNAGGIVFVDEQNVS